MIITVGGIKGGVGKTTIAANLRGLKPNGTKSCAKIKVVG